MVHGINRNIIQVTPLQYQPCMLQRQLTNNLIGTIISMTNIIQRFNPAQSHCDYSLHTQLR